MRLVLLALVLGALAAAGALAALAATLRPASATGEPVVVTIPSGASVRAIADTLREAGLIRSASIFVLAARLRQIDGRLQHGEYALAPTMSPLDILDRLARGEVVLHQVTIPEGYTAAQIGELLAATELADREAFLRVVREEAGAFPFAFAAGLVGLEGYLFPDTYRFPRGWPPRQIVHRLLARFDERVGPALRDRAAELGVTLHEAVTIASMVEREARLAEERPIIAGVIHNRLRRGWRLEIDATVLYALGEHRPQVTEADLQVDSPYNTYRYPGLPPGPIANPGLAAIEAALFPADVPYLFYVLKPDGSHAFSVTLEEHQRAVRRWRR